MPRPALPIIRSRSLDVPHRSRRGGFALLITVTLLAFLVLLLVSLASLTRVETQVAGNNQQLSQARQNALMALNIALGQLQKHTGPDQRVTATADLQPVQIATTADPASGTSLDGTTATVTTSIDNYWRASRNRRWTGAWRDPNPQRTGLDTNNPADSTPKPELLSWLVSGNEKNPDDFKPTSPVSGLTFAAVTASGAALQEIKDGAGKPYRLLVGPKTVSITTATDLDRAVVAPQVEIHSESVAAMSGDQIIGHYAWWVGDEGVKARGNLIDNYSTSPSADDNVTRLQSAQRPAIEAMTVTGPSSGSDSDKGLAPFTGVLANNPDLEKVLAPNQLPLLGNSSVLGQQLKERGHDFTTYSRGVLADVRHGGLKGDLSKILGQTSAADYRSDLIDILGGSSSFATTEPIISTTSTPYAAYPTSFSGNSAEALFRSATWAQLRSYYNLGNSPTAAVPGIFLNATTASTGYQTQDVQGVGPLMMHAKLFFGLEVNAGVVHLRMRPLVVLANPYTVALTGTWWVNIYGPSVTLRYGSYSSASPPPDNPVKSDADSGSLMTSDTISYQSRLANMVIKNATLQPGEARMFTLKQSSTDTGSGTTAVPELELVDGLDESTTFTWVTGKSIPTGKTHVALYTTSDKFSARLFGADPKVNNGPDDKLLQYVYAKKHSNPSAGSPEDLLPNFLVYPTDTGTREGGGFWFTQNDALTGAQQSIFSQYNLRAAIIFWTGISSTSGHPLERALTYARNGASGNSDWFKADLLLDSSADLARWGSVNNARRPAYTLAPSGVGAQTGFSNLLYDLPRPGRPVVSLGQLQHFSPSGFISKLGDWVRFDGATSTQNATNTQYSVLSNTFQSNYPIGNSYPNIRVSRHLVMETKSMTGPHYDGSWLLNEALTDRFFFSSYPASGAFDFASEKLINDRNRPFRDRSSVAWDATANFRASSRSAARNLLVEGAFNINSTSREAWKAILSSLKDIPVNGQPGSYVPFSRTLAPTGGFTDARTGNAQNSWTGFHNLTMQEINNLADEIVLQVRKRGPFLSMADFINRRLITTANDKLNVGLSGALQAAIDARLNQLTDVASVFRAQSDPFSSGNIAEDAYRQNTLITGFPGYILQGDLLSPLAPSLSARSDTFTIRTYGDVRNPATGDISGRAWCEAVVQRLPDYVVAKADGGNDPEEKPAAGSPNADFGRRYQIISTRWLGPDDI